MSGTPIPQTCESYLILIPNFSFLIVKVAVFNFFLLSFLLSIPAFFLGIVNPKWVAAPTRKRSIAMYGGLMAASLSFKGISGRSV